MAFDAYLNIDTIPGESLDAAHTDWIELTGYPFSSSQPVSATASCVGGASSGRVKVSPKLFEASGMGTHIKNVVLKLHRADGDTNSTFA